MRILILGDSGFIGSELCHELEGHEIIGIDEKGKVCNYNHIVADCTVIDFHHILEEYEPDVIINSAAIVGVDKVTRNPLLIYKNLTISHKLCKALDDWKGKKPLVMFFSSSEVYGNTTCADSRMDSYNLIVDNDRSSYAIGKLFEENSYFYLKNHGYEVVVMRLFNIVGKGQSDDFVLSKFIKNLKAGITCRVSATERRFCSVHFLTDCIRKIIQEYSENRKTSFPSLTNFCSYRKENFMNMLDLYHLCEQVTGIYRSPLISPSQMRIGDIICRDSLEPDIDEKFLNREKDVSVADIIKEML